MKSYQDYASDLLTRNKNYVNFMLIFDEAAVIHHFTNVTDL
jgi:hypothetical protein